MSFAGKWMELEIIMLSEDSGRQISHVFSHIKVEGGLLEKRKWTGVGGRTKKDDGVNIIKVPCMHL
jgi:hypothetical protein